MKTLFTCTLFLLSTTLLAAITAPKAPRGVNAEPCPECLIVTWAPVPEEDNGGAPILGYQAQAWVTDEETLGVCSASGNENTCTIYGLAPGIRHKVAVRAWNIAGYGEWSTTVYATPNNKPSIEGELVFASDYQRDSDTPDRDDASNDTQEEAQSTKKHKTIIGHADETEDEDDWYKIKVSNGRVDLTLWTEPADNSYESAIADLDLYVYNSQGDLVRSSLGDHTVYEASYIVSNTARIYYIRINAFSGKSNYTLYVDDATSGYEQHSSPFAHQWTTETEFMPSQAILGVVQQGNLPLQTQIKQMEANGLFKLKAGSPNREMLVITPSNLLDPVQAKADTLLHIKKLRKQQGIANVELNYITRIAEVPNDPDYEDYQWNLEQINLPEAWDEEKGSDDIVIAVLDTGHLDHPDLNDRVLTRDDGTVDGYDFILDPRRSFDGDGIDPDPWDAEYDTHGIKSAGVIAAETDNDQGIAGVTWKGKILPIRIQTGSGGTRYDIMQGIRYAAGLDNDSEETRDQPAHVINMSVVVGSNKSNCYPWKRSRLFDNLVEKVLEQGSLIVKSAGNDSCPHVDSWNQNEDILTVSATTINNDLANYSSYGEDIDTAAPAGEWGSYQNNPDFPDVARSTGGEWEGNEFKYGYYEYLGTSAAAPHVSGVVALMVSANNNLTPYDILRLVRGIHDDENANEVTDDIGDDGWDKEFGHGLINAKKAVDVAKDIEGGSGPIEEPRLHLDKRFLFYALDETTQSIRVSNIGSGDEELVVNDITGSDRYVESYEQDDDDPNLYHITILREEFPNKSRFQTTEMTVESNGGNVSFLLVVLTKSAALDPDVGPIWVFAYHMETGKRYATMLESSSETEYRIQDVPVGDYWVYAGTDMDNDGGTIYDLGEINGEYFLDGIRLFTISTNEVVENVDFYVNVELFYRR